MVTGLFPPKDNLSRENILKLISEEDIFSYFLPGIKYGRAMKSPFRSDENPSFLITNNGRPRFCDMADTSVHGDCFDLVCQLYPGSDLYDAMTIINDLLGLGLEGGAKKDYKRIIQALPKPKEKEPSLIQVITKEYPGKLLSYWNILLQSRDDLIKEEVFAIDKAFLNGKPIPIDKDELAMAYGFGEEDKWKLYFPERGKKENKWISNIPTSMVEKLENLTNCQKGMIQKSRKDRMVVSKIFPNVCSLQNETRAGLTPEVVSFIEENCEQVWLGFDNDTAGRKNSEILCRELRYKPFFVPVYHRVKDPAGWTEKKGIYPLTNYLLTELGLETYA